jgi:uncharacterized protein (DUF305 family)
MEHRYRKLAVELAIDFVAMYLVMYAMIDTWNDFYLNINSAYMTLMMLSPMAVVMLFGMRSMYPNARLNAALYAIFTLVFLLSFSLTRTQTPIGDAEFLRSMIPHHSSAILMCERSSIRDPEIVQLCEQIVQGQKAEIAQMKRILARR